MTVLPNRLIAAATLCILGILGTATALAAQPTYEFNLPPQSLADALKAIGRQTAMNILFEPETVENLTAPAVRGLLSAEEAVKQVLTGTRLVVEETAANSILVAPAQAASKTKGSATEARNTSRSGPGHRLAQAENNGQSAQQTDSSSGSSSNSSSGASSSSDSSSDESDSSGIYLTEVLVTAQKRVERLIDVPQSVTVLSSGDLTKIGATQFRDFANTVPGLNFTTSGAGNTQVSLRGVTVGLDISPTVGIYVDEVPYGSSVAFGSGSVLALDVGLFDLDRIEVLRGPQGTLYGASTMGGLFKYVTRRPDVTRFAIDAQTGVSGTHDGGVSYNGAAMVNAPIAADKAALRASGFYSRDGGYIDNFALGQNDVNRADIYGGRADLLLAPADALGIRITGFLQDISRDGQATADYTLAGAPVVGQLEQRRFLPEPFDQRFRLVSATVTYDAGSVALTSISSYQTMRALLQSDVSVRFTPIFRSFSAIATRYNGSTDKFTQELRLASTKGAPFEWLIGGFYTRENTKDASEFVLRDLAGQPAPNTLLTFFAPSRHEESAAFGDLTWRLTDKFDVTGGTRYARARQSFEQTGSGLASSIPFNSSTDEVFTYLASARYRVSDRATGYLRYATGYRPGGPNNAVNDPVTGLPLGPKTYESDALKSYELGLKAETADWRFGIDVAAYYVDWSNIQININRGGVGFKANAPGGASVRGAELTLTTRPTHDFTVTGAFAYQDAQMSEADPDLRARKGEQLPGVPRFTATLNADYELPMGDLQPTIGATLRYADERTTSFDNSITVPQYRVPDYTTADLRAGFTFGSVRTQLYARNLFDELGQLSAALTNLGTARAAMLQPRTIGVTVSAAF